VQDKVHPTQVLKLDSGTILSVNTYVVGSELDAEEKVLVQVGR
jgi:hypothetical protein